MMLTKLHYMTDITEKMRIIYETNHYAICIWCYTE